jgi:hypothetical protein
MRKWITYCAIAGALIPLAIIIVHQFQPLINSYFVVFLWPSGLGTMGLQKASASTIYLIAFLIGLNAVVYSVVGLVVWYISKLLRRI